MLIVPFKEKSQMLVGIKWVFVPLGSTHSISKQCVMAARPLDGDISCLQMKFWISGASKRSVRWAPKPSRYMNVNMVKNSLALYKRIRNHPLETKLHGNLVKHSQDILFCTQSAKQELMSKSNSYWLVA